MKLFNNSKITNAFLVGYGLLILTFMSFITLHSVNYGIEYVLKYDKVYITAFSLAHIFALVAYSALKSIDYKSTSRPFSLTEYN